MALTRIKRTGLCLAALVACALAPGCVTLKELCSRDCPPRGTPCQVVAQWETQVAHAADPVSGGTLKPGIAGRLYLFGPTIDYPMACDGTLTVELFNQTDNANPSEPLERWTIDPVTLARLGRKGGIGWGYSLFLPWATYRPEINQVRLRVKFEPTKGTPLFADNPGIRLGSGPLATPRQVVHHSPTHNPPQQQALPTLPPPAPLPGTTPQTAPTPAPALPSPTPQVRPAPAAPAPSPESGARTAPAPTPSMKAALANYPPMPTPPPRMGGGPGFVPVTVAPPRVIPPLPEGTAK